MTQQQTTLKFNQLSKQQHKNEKILTQLPLTVGAENQTNKTKKQYQQSQQQWYSNDIATNNIKSTNNNIKMKKKLTQLLLTVEAENQTKT